MAVGVWWAAGAGGAAQPLHGRGGQWVGVGDAGSRFAQAPRAAVSATAIPPASDSPTTAPDGSLTLGRPGPAGWLGGCGRLPSCGAGRLVPVGSVVRGGVVGGCSLGWWAGSVG